jgi:hypothetical protein
VLIGHVTVRNTGAVPADLQLVSYLEFGLLEFMREALGWCYLKNQFGLRYDPALGAIQRIEQCADRVTITAGGIIHDMRCDGTEEHGVNDVAEFDKQTPISVVATFEDHVHVLRPVGLPIEVKRWRDGDDLVWQYVGFTCRLVRLGPPAMQPG